MSTEQQTEALAEAQTTALLLEHWEEVLGKKEQTWSDYFEGFADKILNDPNVLDWAAAGFTHEFAGRVKEIIPDLRKAEETGKNLLVQRLRIAEEFIGIGLTIESEHFIRKENK